MPSYSEHEKSKSVKTIIAADSGMGKTSSLAALANAGYRVAILDFDNGLDILDTFLDDVGRKNLYYYTLDAQDPKSVNQAASLVLHWKTDSEDLGKVSEWGPNDVFVIDTATKLGECCLKKNDNPNGQKAYGDAQKDMEKILLYLAGPKIKCNLIVNTHYYSIEDPNTGRGRVFPNMLGKRTTSTMGNNFNNTWRIDIEKSAKGVRRVLRTQADLFMSLKNSAPNDIDAVEPLDLAAIFNKILKKEQ